ncbi:hypothetical protein ACJW30_07G092400 [Castanea mollissima]
MWNVVFVVVSVAMLVWTLDEKPTSMTICLSFCLLEIPVLKNLVCF